MIKAFENYEVWFVTGAQLLYGGDAVSKLTVTPRRWSTDLTTPATCRGRLYIKVQPTTPMRLRTSWWLPTPTSTVSASSHGCILSRLPRCGYTACRSSRASAPPPHTVQQDHSLRHNGYGLHESEPECPRRPRICAHPHRLRKPRKTVIGYWEGCQDPGAHRRMGGASAPVGPTPTTVSSCVSAIR